MDPRYCLRNRVLLTLVNRIFQHGTNIGRHVGPPSKTPFAGRSRRTAGLSFLRLSRESRLPCFIGLTVIQDPPFHKLL
jgi:hypothetical protein